jgi:tetratricopeptide (TPR) repeat protein
LRLRDAATLLKTDKPKATAQLREIVAELQAAARQHPDDAQTLLLLGTAHTHLGEDEAAIAPFAKVTELRPKSPAGWLNLGQAYQNLGRAKDSLAAYGAALKLEPDNWRARAKVVQNHQSLGQIEQRDRERTTLLRMREAKKIDQPYYCREQLTHAGTRILAMEHFELNGDRAVRYVFYVIPKGKREPEYRISLGSYAFTNAVDRDAGRLKEGQRLFHLDGYYPNKEHRTFAFFEGEPTYEEARAMALDAIEGKLQPKSVSTPDEIRINVDDR